MGYRIEEGILTISNAWFERKTALPGQKGSFLLRSYCPRNAKFAFFEEESEDFAFCVDGVKLSGNNEWLLEEVCAETGDPAGEGVKVTLFQEGYGIRVHITYIWYPDLPFVRKRLQIKNESGKRICLESVDVESFAIREYAPTTFSWIYADYGRRRQLGPYRGTMQDSLVLIHHPEWESGIVLGNEAPGVLKGLSAWSRGRSVTLGLTHTDEAYPFRNYLNPGESFTSPDVFTGVYGGQPDVDQVLNRMVSHYVRDYMGIRISQIKRKPVCVYNTWEPFEFDISEKLVMETAAAAAKAGVKEYVIDDGWSARYGDWEADTEKFPHGLKYVVDYIRSLGMKAGIWISIGTASPKSRVYREHPEWFCKNRDGKDISMVMESEDKCTACFSTGWAEYITDVLERLLDEYGFEYLKLDFSIVSSPYRYDPAEAGCYAKNHPGHADREESMWVNYGRMWEVFDRLHQSRENLYIDCTFETMGGLQLIDYAMLRHAEGNWLSNFAGAEGEKTDLRIRQMAWWRSPAMPAASLVIGNAELQDSACVNHFYSLAGALPMLCGDPRELSEETAAELKRCSDWLERMEERYRIMSFREDLPGLFEPRIGAFDGFARINRDTKEGGIIGLFRHGAAEESALLRILDLPEHVTFRLIKPDGQQAAAMTGREWGQEGVRISFEKLYEGKLFELTCAGEA